MTKLRKADNDFRQLAVEMCALTLEENAAKHSELLMKFTRLQKSYEALRAEQPSGENGAVQQSYVMWSLMHTATRFAFHTQLLSNQ